MKMREKIMKICDSVAPAVMREEYFDDLEEELLLIEQGFDIKFEGDELTHIHNFDELTSLIISKIDMDEDNSCTSSHLFYKLRRFIAYFGGDVTQLRPDTKLEDIFPSKGRRRKIRILEHYLGFKLNLLAPHHILLSVLAALFFVGIMNLFTSVIVGLIVLAISVLGFYLAFTFGKTLQYDTVRNLIEDAVLYNYLDIRKNTVNRKEIEILLNKHYCGIMRVKKEELTQIQF